MTGEQQCAAGGGRPEPSVRRRALWTALLGAFVLGWLGFFYRQPAMLTSVGVGHYRIELAPDRYHELWFLDAFAILASNDALAAGADPYAPNRLDYMQRPHVYGPAWLVLRHLGLTRAHVGAVGLWLGAAFVLVVVLFFRPRDPRSLLWCLAIVCTTPVLAALERANNDLVVFLILSAVVPCLSSRRAAVRTLAIVLIAVAAALKYYPAAAALILLAASPARELRWRIGATAAAFALIAWHVAAPVPGYAVLPAPRGVLSFGAASIFHELGMDGVGVQLVAVFAALLLGFMWWRSPLLRDWRPPADRQSQWLHFVLGGALLTGCFFVGQHFAYRWVFAIWLAPLLWSLPQDSRAPAPVRTLARVTAWLLLAMLWTEAVLVFAVRGWPQEKMTEALRWIALGMQPPTWAFYCCVAGFLVHFTREGVSRLRDSRAE